MKNIKILITVSICIVVIILGVMLGSVSVSAKDVLSIIIHKILKTSIPDEIAATDIAIVWNLRFPRALLAFIAGGALSVSGAVMQSVLRNPLASSYTLGVSSGASLGAGIVILFGFTLPVFTSFTLPVMGFLFGLVTIIAAISLASRLDGQMQNNTIILTGMVFSLFINAITTLLSAFAREQMQRLIYWQMGSFSMKDWHTVFILAPIVIAGVIIITCFHHELDIMTFGEEQAQTVGINIKKVKWILLILSAALTGSVISFVGVIGFVDLVAPHIIRRIFGSSHKYVIPMSALFGGAFMVVCDLAARTVVSPSELPVGAVTAIIGAPFFAYIYFGKRKEK